MTEKEKADSISRLLSKAARKKPRQPAKLVVARGLNRGIKGRPKGVKGRYRIVDPRMKKELRAQKRVAQKKKR
jgi:AdoMet-dependent rRNA methyltransferase SPB1